MNESGWKSESGWGKKSVSRIGLACEEENHRMERKQKLLYNFLVP